MQVTVDDDVTLLQILGDPLPPARARGIELAGLCPIVHASSLTPTRFIADTAGQEEFDAMRDSWARHGDCFLLVFSYTSRKSFATVMAHYTRILRVKARRRTSNTMHVPKLCVLPLLPPVLLLPLLLLLLSPLSLSLLMLLLPLSLLHRLAQYPDVYRTRRAETCPLCLLATRSADKGSNTLPPLPPLPPYEVLLCPELRA